MCVFFCCLGGGRVYFFAVWAGGVFFFCCLGGGVFFFCCLGGGMFLFCCLGRGRVFFLLFARGTGVHSLTRLPGSSLSDPTTKETEQQKKNTGSALELGVAGAGSQTSPLCHKCFGFRG